MSTLCGTIAARAWGSLALLTVFGCASQQTQPATAVEQPGAVVLGAEPEIPKPPPPPNLRVNQLGYVPSFPKFAVLVTPSSTPLSWQLLERSGKVLAAGTTIPFGADADSGDQVQQIDFTSFRQSAQGLVLRVGSDQSPPFDVRADLYRKLVPDALAYFYHARSGIEIKLPYAGAPQWTRPAGHLSDRKVPCAPDAGCSYTLDVSGGWYDAGDHGKYVVNGGISVWTLLNLYERTKYLAPFFIDDFGDGKLNIPEQGNRVPDLLDEVRWELEFLLKMQVPEGEKLAGMAHHKIHDEKWTSLGGAPATDTAQIKMARYLHRPSTAATLNLAATAAQAARIYREFDREFAERCARAAERAWKAARAHPDLFAPPTDTVGGGPYDDDHVADEFYWAAAELFITTNQPEYKEYLAQSPFYLKIPQAAGKDGKSGPRAAMTWQLTAALGTISLGIVPNQLDSQAIAAARQQVIDRAEEYLKIQSKQGYRVPFQADEQGKYPWGSNSFVVTNALLLGLAYDLTHKPEYLRAVVDAMNYLLGVNAMGQSYVTGYGSRPLQNPHHRFWAHQLNPSLPGPPPGCLSGGPNSGLEDPLAQKAGLPGCKPQKCFIDHIDSWSTNEITINWNAPFAWVAAFLDQAARSTK